VRADETASPFSPATSYNREPFAFPWEAKLSALPGVTIIGEDAHDGEKGWGGSRLCGLIPMGSRQGPEVFRMQLVRHLAEFPWMPQLALRLPELTWKDTGESTFQVSASIGAYVETVTFTLGGDDEVIRASGTRPYDVPGGFEEAPWTCEFSGHRGFGEIQMPEEAVATYAKRDGEWAYLRCEVVSAA
jgi:Family of unknown function (DUF6544)